MNLKQMRIQIAKIAHFYLTLPKSTKYQILGCHDNHRHAEDLLRLTNDETKSYYEFLSAVDEIRRKIVVPTFGFFKGTLKTNLNYFFFDLGIHAPIGSSSCGGMTIGENLTSVRGMHIFAEKFDENVLRYISQFSNIDSAHEHTLRR